jgi:arylformamidase
MVAPSLPLVASLAPEILEREYNNRALVPDHPAYFARWERDSEFVRATLPGVLDVPYGPDPRHRVDLFPAAGSRGTLVFIHGGYWRSLDKRVFSWLAASFVAEGLSVAMLNYRLCPAVKIPQIVDDVVLGANWLFTHAGAHGVSMDRVAVAGHSAGGHLVGALFATPRERLAFDPARIVGGVPVSGIFDFSLLRLHSFNADLHLDDASAKALDLHDKRPVVAAPLVVAAGADESAEFQRQSRLIAGAWGGQVRSLLLLPGLNHFSVVDAFAERGSRLNSATLALFPS